MKANIELLLLVEISHIDIKKTHDCKKLIHSLLYLGPNLLKKFSYNQKL